MPTKEEFIAEAHRRMDKVIDIVIGGRYQATVREIEAEMTACGIPFTQRDVPNYVEEDDEDIVGTVNIEAARQLAAAWDCFTNADEYSTADAIDKLGARVFGQALWDREMLWYHNHGAPTRLPFTTRPLHR
ncbi:hypothetical protein CLAFUW4_10743 [Fulvia fulva]|uniref:Uncharacterized protein n=1 Tax=Passalora fulva TaxID=5499 RepID=A0A9Q8P7I3_PASFU|nr:uncharacterized protein CLAFUR5_05356 [Fulvia fulva]KAK4615956.1 hypothetical protein CLAFUR4_10748 [Fulvia fulva]KAK4616521.1 hypothetical protein CLAFUR0_10755 [Fulvia fulva]UJO16051.1 hypothetical protein CLAFUR5_05356 [Fulvia fulva]WPV19739.1 hypothetical protein CLAFUW4_10743 [Fulvia fulva]WPV33700.1 hypothetical protein CLAFUW7_10745 [Fulvia fulva]